MTISLQWDDEDEPFLHFKSDAVPRVGEQLLLPNNREARVDCVRWVLRDSENNFSNRGVVEVILLGL